MISSRLASGLSLSTAVTALFTFCFVNPSMMRAALASSTVVFELENKADVLSVPSPFVTLSLSSRISLCALLSPIPFMLLILFISSDRMAFLISSEVSDELLMTYGISTRPGAQCAPLMHEALGTVGQGSVRFSFSHYNTEEEVETAINAIRELAEEE